MLKAIVSAQRGTPVTDYPGLPPVKHGMIAIPQTCQDERGYSLNHQQRILKKLAKIGVKYDTNINFVLMQLKHVTVESIRFATIVAKADEAFKPADEAADEAAGAPADKLEYEEANEEANDLAYQQEHGPAYNTAQPATDDEAEAAPEPTGLTGRVWQFVKAKVTSAN